MTPKNFCLGCALPALLAAMLAAMPAAAHGIVGNRFFPATVATDDPAVAEELSLPTVSWFKNADGNEERDISAEYSKRITPKLGISFDETWIETRPPGGPSVQGFDNLGLSLKYEFLKDAPSETILSAGVDMDIGGTGAAKIGAESFSTFTPTVYFGKGFGDLPARFSLAKPFAVTGLIGYRVPTVSHDRLDPVPQSLTYGFALEYSLPYLASHVRDFGWPRVVDQLTPLVEAAFDLPVVRTGGEPTTGTINPGLIWSGQHFQLAAEADFPINGASAKTVGATVQLHFYIDDIFPHSFGAPIFRGGRI